MSMTHSIGVVGPSHWSYMAGVLSERLEKAIDHGVIEPNTIPRGVHRDAQEFFRLILQAFGGVPPENPPASMNAFVIASDVMRGFSAGKRETLQELKQRFSRFADIVNGLSDAREIEENELPLLRDLQKFFCRLHEEGESEAYERRLQLEVPFVGHRF
jgi:hypothetical protein